MKLKPLFVLVVAVISLVRNNTDERIEFENRKIVPNLE